MSTIIIDGYIKILKKGDVYFDTMVQFPIIKGKYRDSIVIRTLLLNAVSSHYSRMWEDNWKDIFRNERWGRESELLSNDQFGQLSKIWKRHEPFRSDYVRRELLVELDVLVGQAIGLSLEDLKNLYLLQFPLTQQYEEDTWYDLHGNIVFTCSRSLTQVGVERNVWEESKNKIEIKKMTEIEYIKDKLTVEEVFIGPFKRCNRIEDYEEVWHTFEERFKA